MNGSRMMRIIGWSLVALGLCAPVLTFRITHATPYAAGSASGTGFLISIVTIIWVLVQSRSMREEKRGRAYLIAGAIVLGVNLLSSFNIAQGARVNREIVAARPEIDRIMAAAAAEGALIHSGRLEAQQISPEWRPYAAATAIDLSDSATPLRNRFVELMRRAKLRELDLARALHAEASASGIGAALVPERLLDAQARADCLGGIARYRRFVDAYSEKVKDLQRQGQKDIHALQLPHRDEEEMVRELQRAGTEATATISKFVDGEMRAIDSVQALIAFVEARAASTHVVDGQLVFSDTSSQTQYEKLMARAAGVGGSR
jgi:hypothetical protein